MNYSELYNDAYKKFTPEFLHENYHSINSDGDAQVKTLKEFIKDFEINKNLNFYGADFLELGCGMGFLTNWLASEYNTKVVGVDISNLAVGIANEINSINSKTEFKVFDITKNNTLNSTYDFLVDSHLLHCLPKIPMRKQYFNFLKKHMRKDSRVFIETMVFQKNLRVPIGYNFDEKYTLYKTFNGHDKPIRSIYTTHMIEEEVIRNGFKIDYFYYHDELAFSVFESDETNFEFLPRTLRMSLTLK